jgi:hypothetical protein
MIYNIFYNSTKDISWCTDGDVSDAVKTAQADLGLSFVALDLAQIPACDKYYINSDEDGVVAYSSFDLSYSATSIAIDGTVTITGCPAGTEIFMDTVSQGTYSSGDLTLTGTTAGSFALTFKKDKYYDAGTQITVTRYGA